MLGAVHNGVARFLPSAAGVNLAIAALEITSVKVEMQHYVARYDPKIPSQPKGTSERGRLETSKSESCEDEQLEKRAEAMGGLGLCTIESIYMYLFINDQQG